jgi:iron complex outermembrane receptor protein
MTLRTVVAGILLSFASIAPSLAQAAVKHTIDIPQQQLGSALTELAKQTHIQVVYTTDLVEGRRTNALSGTMTPEEALNQLLSKTGLRFEFLDAQTVTLSRGTGTSAPPAVPTNTGSPRSAQMQNEQSADAQEAKGAQKNVSFWDRFRLAQVDQGKTASNGSIEESKKPADSNTGEKLEEIIVTATKRQMNLQDVPFGISALTAGDLERNGASGAEDYLAEVPGVHYTALGRGRSPIVIRGVSTEGSNLNNLQNTIETYVDDLPTLNRFSAWTNTDLNTFDIERVEVLRGPQGTLFGSGAIGGAIRIITNKPDLSRSSGKIEAGLGSTDRGEVGENVSGVINLPIVPDRLGVRGVGYVRHDAGYVDNVRRDEADVDGGRTSGGRLMVAYAPADRLNLRLSVTHEHDIVDDSPKAFPQAQGANAYRWDGAIPERSDIKLSVFNLVGEYDFGAATLTSSTTYGVRHSFFHTDFIRLLSTIFNVGIDPDGSDAWIKHDTDTFAQELRLTSKREGPLEWTGGAFFMRQHVELRQVASLSALPTLVFNDYVPINSKEKAVFGEVTYSLSKKFSITAGARWFDNTFVLANGTVAGAAGVFDTPDFAPVETGASAVTPKLSMSFHPTDRTHFYATAAKGYRVGQTNFNAGLNQGIPKGFEPDSLWNYEVGMKSRWLDNRLKTNLAAFYIDWSNIQLQRFITLPNGQQVNPIVNAGQAAIKGAEAELAFGVADGWEIGSSLTYTHARLDSVLSGVPLTPGSTLPGSPDFSASSYVQFTTESLPAHASGYVRLAHRYVGKVFGDINNSDLVASDTYNVFDVRTGIYLGRYEFALYGDNLANSDAAVTRQSVGDIVPYAIRLRPRTIGLTLRAQF